MGYITNPDILKVKICGTDVLIPTRSASAVCKTVRRLPFPWNCVWDGLKRGTTVPNMIKGICLISKRDASEVEKEFDEFFNALYREGFLLREESEPADGKTGEAQGGSETGNDDGTEEL